MAITFAGVDLLLEDPEGAAAAHVQRYLGWPESQINAPSRVIDTKSRIQRPNWPDRPKLKPNQLYMPSGATRWGQFFGLATTTQKNAIIAELASGGSLGILEITLDDDPVAVPVVTCTEDDGTFDLQNSILAYMHMLPPQPVARTAAATDDDLWIIPLVDERFWWQTAMFVSVAETWADLLSEFRTSLGASMTRDTIADVDSEYGIPDACFFRNGAINTAAAVDLYCWCTNQRLVPKDISVGTWMLRGVLPSPPSTTTGTTPTGSTTSSTTLSPDCLYTSQRDAQLTTVNSGLASAGGECDSTYSGDVPSEIKFHFTNDGSTELLAYIAGTAPLYADGGTLDVVCPATSTGSNDADLEAMADKWANGFWNWSKWRFNWSFNRLLNWHMIGYEDYVLIDLSRHRRGYNARTVIKTLPPISWGMDTVPTQLSTGGNTCGGGSNGSTTSACGCCDCKDCLPPDVTSIGSATCSACTNGAAGSYTFNPGVFAAYPALGGLQTVTHVSGCTWQSGLISVTTAAWAASRYYYANDYVLHDSGKQYKCVTAGTSGTTGPTGTGTGITDGAVTWDYSP